MGYSSSIRASLTYKAIMMLSQFDEISDNFEFFCEIGKENADGSMTGKVYQFTDEERRFCVKKGNFKIGADGYIVRFPGLDKFLWGIPHIAMMEAYDRMFPEIRTLVSKNDNWSKLAV